MTNTNIPIRTYSMSHPIAGYIEFSIPVMNPKDVDAYLILILADLPITDRMKLHNELMKWATEMWNAFSLFVGDADAARLELRQDPEITAWLAAG